MFITRIRADAGGDRSPYGDFWFEPIGARTGSGVRVTADSAMALPAVWACVNVLAKSFAVMPFNLWEPSELTRKKRTDHWLYKLICKAPNRFQSPHEWKMMLMGHLALRGNSYHQIGERGGAINELLPLHPDRMKMELLDNGSYRYRYTDQNGKEIIYLRTEIWHIRGLSNDGYMGMSPIEAAREAIGEGLAMQAYSSRFYGNDARPRGVIQFDGKFADKAARQTFRESWQETQGGRNVGKVAVLEKGMTYQEMKLTNADAQFLENRAGNLSNIGRIFGIPPHKIGDLAKCMPADTLVFTESGPKRIVDVRVGEKVWSPTTQGPRLCAVSNFWENGTRDVLEIKTTNRTVRCTANHRLLVRRQVEADRLPGQRGGRNVNGSKVSVEWRTAYVAAGDLKPGDTLVTLDRLPDGGTNIAPNGRKVTVGFMEFAGLLAGDGNVFDHGVSIARSGKATYMNHYRDVMRKEFTQGGAPWLGGEDHAMSKLTAKDVEEIRGLASSVVSQSDLARKYGANICTVSAIARGRKYHADHPSAGISQESLALLMKDIRTRTSAKSIASRYGVSTAAVHNIFAGRSWAGTAATREVLPVALREAEMRTDFSSVSAAEELRALGFGGTAFTKSLPGWVFGLKRELRLAYLRGIVDSDGSIDKFGRICVALVNESFVHQIRALFMACGVPVTNVLKSTRTSHPPGSKGDVVTTMYLFTCSDPAANREVGSHDTRYIERLDGGKPFGRKDRAYPRHGGAGFAVDGLSLARITSIDARPAEPVYDIEVEGEHCFFADGVASHNSTNNNIEHQSIEFWTDAMHPLGCCVASSMEFNLLGPDSDLDCEFDIRPMMRGDGAARSTRLNRLVLGGVLVPNEARAEEGYDPMPGGDDLLRPVNMATVNEDGTVELAEAPESATPGGPTQPGGESPDGTDRTAPESSRMTALLAGNANRMARRIAAGNPPSPEVLSDAMAITVQSAEVWLSLDLSGLTENDLAASLLHYAMKGEAS